MFDLASHRGWHLVQFCARTSHLFNEATSQIVARRSDFPPRNSVHFTWGVHCCSKESKNTWEICLDSVHTSFTLYALSRGYFHLRRDFCFITSSSSYSLIRFVDTKFSYFFYLFTDGWFCAGPAPVYQHHHHSRPYAHIPSSPYERLGIRGHRPSPYPNPYHKRTDLPTQGKKHHLISFSAFIFYYFVIHSIPARCWYFLNRTYTWRNVNFVSVLRADFDGNFIQFSWSSNFQCQQKWNSKPLLILIFSIKIYPKLK